MAGRETARPGGAERGAPADREAVSMRERISSETMGMGGILL